MSFWSSTQTNSGPGQKPVEAGPIGLGSARHQHLVQASEDPYSQSPYQPGKGALTLLVDSTGIQFLGEGEWKRKKHGADYRRQWHKVHLGIDADTLEVRAVEVTDNSVGDAPMLKELPDQIPTDEPKDLETVQWLSLKVSGGDQIALLQTSGTKGDGTNL